MMICEICGQIAPFLTETYDPKMQKSRAIWLCQKHQNFLFLTVDEALNQMKEEHIQEQPCKVYGVGNTPTFIPHPPITYEIPLKDLKEYNEKE